MPGGLLMGLGRGIEAAGDTYAKMKMAAIDRMFREQQMALQRDQFAQTQKQFDATQANNQFDQTRQIFSQLPAGSDVSNLQVPAGGRALADAFTKRSPVVQDVPSTLMVPSDYEGPGEVHSPAPLLPTNPVPERAPAEFEMSTATSIPFEDARSRTAMYNQMNANQRHAGTQQTRVMIQGMRDAVAREVLAARERRDTEGMKQGWARLQQMNAALQSLDAYRDAQIGNMDFDNQALQYKLNNPTAGGSGMDPMMMLLMGGAGGGMPRAGGAAGVPALTPAAPRPPAPVPPRLQKGGGGQPVDPNDPLGLLK